MGKFSDAGSFFNSRNQKPQAPQQPDSPSANLQNQLLKEQVDATTQEREGGYDAFQQYKGGSNFDEQGQRVGNTQEDILMSGGTKLGKSLVAGTGDVIEQVVDLTQLVYNFATPLGAAERAVGLDFSKNFFDWVKENTSQELQDYAVTYQKPGSEDFKWSDMGTADFWTTDFARQVPNLLSMMAGGAGLVKGAGTLMTKMATKSIAKGGTRLAKAGALSSKVVDPAGRTIGQIGGKGIGKLFTRSEGAVGLSTKGKLVAGIGGGAGMNLVDGGIVAGMAYDRALEEFGSDDEGRKLAGQIAADIFIDNSKWMAVDALSWGFTFGGGSKIILGKATQKLGQIQNGFGKRAANILVNASAGSAAGAAIAGAATLGEEGMDDAMKTGALAGLGAGLLKGTRGVKAAGMLAPEGIEEMFQETYQEWIEKKAFNEARGEEEKTPTYWDFYSSDEARKTKAISLISGMAGSTVGGYTNLINDVADRSFENDKKIDAINSIMDRANNADNTYDKTSAMYDMVSQAVADQNDDNLLAWINGEASREGGAVDAKLQTELVAFMNEQKKTYEKVGSGMKNITANEKSRLFRMQTGISKNTAEFNEQSTIYNEQKADLTNQLKDIESSNLSDSAKKQAASNLNERIAELDADFNTLQNNVNKSNSEIQEEINTYTTSLITKSKVRKAASVEGIKDAVKSATSQIGKFGKGVKEFSEGVFDGVNKAKADYTKRKQEEQAQQAEQAPEGQEPTLGEQVFDMPKENVFNIMTQKFRAFYKGSKDIDTDMFTDEQLDKLISESLTENGVDGTTNQEEFAAKVEAIEKTFNEKHKTFVENKAKAAEESEPTKKSTFQKAKEKGTQFIEKAVDTVKEGAESVKEAFTKKELETEVVSKEKSDTPKVKDNVSSDVIEDVEFEEVTENSEKDNPKKAATNEAFDKDIANLEDRIAKETNKETLKKLNKKLDRLKRAKLRKVQGEPSKPIGKKESVRKAKKDAKKAKDKYKYSWYNPLGILERRKFRKERTKKVKEAIAKFDEAKKQNSLHYVYALKDANYPNTAIITLAEMSQMFGEAGTSAVVNATIYASNRPDFANVVKHEFGHVLYPLFEDTPLMQDIKRLILEDGKIIKNITQTYPELILFDTELGPQTIEEIIRNPNVYKNMLDHNSTIEGDIKSIIESLNTGRIFTNEINSLLKKIEGMDSISVAKPENQELLIEEAFAHYLEKDSITLADIIAKDVKTEQRLKRKVNIVAEKIKVPSKATDEQKLEIIKAMDSPANKADTLEEALDIIRRNADSRSKIHKPKRSSRVMRKKPNKSLNDIAQAHYENSELIKAVLINNRGEYEAMIMSAIERLSGKELSQEQIKEILQDESAIFLDRINKGDSATSGLINEVNDEYNEASIDDISGSVLSELIAEGTLGNNEITQALESAGILDKNSERIPFLFEEELDDFVMTKDSNDNVAIQNERSSTSKFIDAFVLYLNSERGKFLLESGKLEGELNLYNEGAIRRAIRKEFRKALVPKGENVFIADFMDSIINPKTPLLKAFKQFTLELYKDKYGSVAGSNQYLNAIARGIHHEQSSNVVESRDVLFYTEKDSDYFIEPSIAEFEQFVIEDLITDNETNVSLDILRLLKDSKRVNMLELIEAIGDIKFKSKSVQAYLDQFAIQESFTFMHKGKTLKAIDVVNDIIKSNGKIDSELLKSIATEITILSRDLNQITMVDMARLEAGTSLLNKTSSLYEGFSSMKQYLNDQTTATNETIKEVSNGSVFDYLINKLGISPKISASSGVRVTDIDGMIKGDSYVNLSPDEILMSDILRMLTVDENSYQMPIMVFSEKSRRYNVTVPKYKDLRTAGKSIESKFVIDLAQEIEGARYSEGNKVSNLFKLSDGNTVLEKIINKEELAKQVKFLENYIKDNPYIITNLIQNGVIKSTDGKVPKPLLEDLVVSTALNKYSAQKTLVAKHSDRKSSVDYTKRSAMAIARRRPVFEHIEYIITPDLYYNPNAKDGLEYLTDEDLDSGDFTAAEKAEYKLVDDAQSLMLPEDARLLNKNAGLGNEYGSVYKTVHSGRDTRVDGIDAGDTYLKHNTVVLSDKYIAMSIENGYVGLAKLRAIMKNRKEHLLTKFETNVAIVTMPKSAVKSGTKNKFFTPLDVKEIKITEDEILSTFSNLSSNSINATQAQIKLLIKNDKFGGGISERTSLTELNEQRDGLFAKSNEDGLRYVGFDASKFGVQNILESQRNETTSTTPIQLLSNYLQSVPTDALKSEVIDLLDTYAKAVDLYSNEQIDNLPQDIKDMIDPSWAGSPMSYLVSSGLINLPGIQLKLQEVLSKNVISGATKLRGPGGIAFETSPYGFKLKSRVRASEINYIKGNLDGNSIVSEIVLPESMSKKFGVGDIVTATRIPADKLSMSQVYVIKDFFDGDAGQVVAIPEGNSAIKGSDKDGDSLFIDGRINKKELTEAEKAYNNYIFKSTRFISNPEMADVTGLSLENVADKADDYISALEKSGVKVPEEQKDMLTMQFDKYSLQNNLEIRNVLGELIIAFRDTNYLAFYNQEINANIEIEGKVLNKFKDSKNGKEVQFISELVQLVLDNPSKLKAFGLGLNTVVIKDLVLLSRMGFDATSALSYINSPEMLAVYKYTNQSRILKGIDPSLDYYSPEFMAWLEISNNGIKDVRAFVNEINNTKRVEELKTEFNTTTYPKYRKLEKFKLGVVRIAKKPSTDSDSYAIIKVLKAVKSDLSAMSDILNVYNTNPQSSLEIETRINNWKNTKENPLIINFTEALLNDPIIKNRENALNNLKRALKENTAISNDKFVKLSESLSKVFKFDKGYKSKSISNEIIESAYDKALLDVLKTDISQSELENIRKKIQSAIGNMSTDSLIPSMLKTLEDSIYVIPGYVSRATSPEILNNIRSQFEIESKDIEIMGMSFAEALLVYKYNQPSKTGKKGRLINDNSLLSVMPTSIVNKINESLTAEKINKGLTLSRADVFSAARSNIYSVPNVYFGNDVLSPEIKEAIQTNRDFLKFIESNGVFKLANIPYQKLTSSNKNIVDMLFTRQGDNLVFDIEKVKSIIEGGIDIAPIMFNKELHYIDLKSIADNNNPSQWIKKADTVETTPTPPPGKDSAIVLAETLKKKGDRIMRRKVINDSALRSFNQDMTLEEYFEARGLKKSLMKNDTISQEVEKEFRKLKNSKKFIDSLLDNANEFSLANMSKFTKEELMGTAVAISTDDSLEKVGKNAITKEISILIAQKARDEQMALNPEGYAGANEGDVSFFKKWLMSNDVDTNNPDVQAMTRTVEEQYFKFTQEYSKQARPIKVIAKSLKADFYKKVGAVEYVKLWFKGDLNKEIYKNVYEMRTDKDGSEYIVLKKDTTTLSKNEKAFHTEFSRVMQTVSGNEEYTGSIPYHTINSNEAFMRQGLYGMYLTSEGMENHLNSVPVYSTDPISGQQVQRTFLEWKELYANKSVSKSKFKNLKDFSEIKKRAEELLKSGVDEDGTAIEYDRVAINLLLETNETSGYIAQESVNMKEFASYDLESIALKTLRTQMFNYGSNDFIGFKNLGFMIDGVLEYNEDNPNLKEWVQTIYKEYLAKQGPKKKTSKLGKAADAFVLFTTLKVLGPWNIGIPLGNIAIGKYQAMRASGMKQFIKGESRFLNPKNFKKNAALIRNYVSFDMSMYENFYSMQEKTPFDQIADLIMLPMEQSEKYIQGATFLSFLTDEEYNNINVDENGLIVNSPISEKRVIDIMEKVKKEQGKGYNTTNQRLTGMHATSRLLFQFKKYLPTLVAERFGKERINRLGQYQVGSVRAVKNVVTDYMTGKITYEELKNQPKHVREGVRKFRNGVFLSLAIALMAGWDDDDDWKDKLSRDTQLLYDTDKYKYRLAPSAYWNIKSMVD